MVSCTILSTLPLACRRRGCLTRLVSLDELCTLIERHARRPHTAIDGLMLAVIDEPSAPEPAMAGPILALVAQGAKRLAMGERTYDYGAGQFLVVSVDLPVIGHYTEAPFLGLGLVLRPAAVAALLLETSADGRAEAGTQPGMAVSDAPAELLDAAVRLLRLLDHPADLPVLAPLIQKEILWRLLTGDQGAMIRQIGLADSSLSHIGRAIRRIRDRHADALRIDDLAQLSGMSVSSFHRHFRTVTAMTPIQFQKHIRLQQARLLLISTGDDVADVGHRVGYDSASQFSREYRRQFGVPPGHEPARRR